MAAISSVQTALKQLGAPERLGRQAVAYLVGLGPQAVEPVVQLLFADHTAHVQQRAALVLGKVGDKRAIEPLAKLLATAEAPLASAIAKALRRLDASEPLRLVLATGSRPARVASAYELGLLRKPVDISSLISALHDTDRDVRQQAARSLGSIGDTRAIPSLLEAAETHVAPEVSVYLYAMGSIEESTVVKVLTHPSAKVRAAALASFRWRSASPQALRIIGGLLNDENVEVRAAAAQALQMKSGPVLQLIAALRDTEALVRREAVCALGWSEVPLAVDPLMQALVDEDGAVRSEAAQALGRFRDKRSVPALISALNDPQPEVRANAARALGLLDDSRAVEPLLAIMQDEARQVRNNSVEALARLGDGRVVSNLVRAIAFRQVPSWQLGHLVRRMGNEAIVEARDAFIAFLQSENASVRGAAAEALRELADPAAISPLLAAIQDSDPQVRLRIVLALMSFRDVRVAQEITTLLKDPDPGIRAYAVASLARSADDAGVEQLIRALTDDATHGYAARALGQLRDRRAVEPLGQLLNDPGKDRAFEAARALGRIKDKRAVEPLVEAVRTGRLKHVRVDTFAARALGNIGDRRVVPVLLDALNDAWCNDDDQAMMAFAEVLGHLKAKDATPLLLKALVSDSIEVRLFAASALGQIGDHAAIEPLIVALSERYLGVRYAAVLALRRLADARAVEPLLEIWNSGDPLMRRAALEGLGRTGDTRLLETFAHILRHESYPLRKLASRGLILLGSEAVDTLLDMLSNPDAKTRSRAARVLGRIKDKRAQNSLRLMLRDDDAQVRSSAAWALGNMGELQAQDDLVRVLADADSRVRASAVAALGRIAPRNSIEPLSRLRNDPDSKVRLAAAWATSRSV